MRHIPAEDHPPAGGSGRPGGSGEIVGLLLDADLLSPADVVDGDLLVRDLSRSNGVALVSVGREARYVVKRPAPRPAEQGSPDRERAFYRLTRAEGLEELVPAPRLVASLGEVLVLEAAGPGGTLEERHRGRGGPSPHDGRLLGEALGAWRRIAPRFAGPGLPRIEPWILHALTPIPPDVVGRNPGTSRLAARLRSEPVLAEGLEELREGWRVVSPLHGDVRWDNAVVGPDPASGADRVLLVDWEFIDLGDPGWDVAGALADALALQAAQDAPIEERFEPPGGPDLADRVTPLLSTLRSFAAGYRDRLPARVARGDLDAGRRLLPARVLQIAFLHAAWGSSAGLGAALALAGIATALFLRPHTLADPLAEDPRSAGHPALSS